METMKNVGMNTASKEISSIYENIQIDSYAEQYQKLMRLTKGAFQIKGCAEFKSYFMLNCLVLNSAIKYIFALCGALN